MVMDRLFLCIFTVAVLVGTAGIILQAPTLYDDREPIDYQLSNIGLDTSRPGAYHGRRSRFSSRVWYQIFSFSQYSDVLKHQGKPNVIMCFLFSQKISKKESRVQNQNETFHFSSEIVLDLTFQLTNMNKP